MAVQALKDLRALAWRVVRDSKKLGEAPEGCESLVEAVRLLRASFPSKRDSWFYRAVLRCLVGVRRAGASHWLVPGLPELGDAYPRYNVWVREGRYACDCFFRAWGRRRRKEICTHIAAVMLHRRQRKIGEYG
ncbi:MAG: hypothetical protein DRJ56_05430 [Thermoprotei archaeon]|nr:MAG: hypothetical protein DRJ56_05430 [Thermoprotei archaeon]